MSVIVSPSLLSADFLHLSKDIEMVNRSQADWFHLDIIGWRIRPEHILRTSGSFPDKENGHETTGCTFNDRATGTLRGGFS